MGDKFIKDQEGYEIKKIEIQPKKSQAQNNGTENS
jgi:hypothetical protein